MFAKKQLTAFCLTAATLSHGAADKAITLISTAPEPTVTLNPNNIERCDLIGLSVSPRGKYALLASEIQEDMRECTITFVYSEHPALKQDDILSRIAAKIVENIGPDIVETHREKPILKAITQVLDKKSDPKFLKKSLINLMAFQIVLDDTHVNHSGIEIRSDGTHDPFFYGTAFRRKTTDGRRPTWFSCSSHFGQEEYEPLRESAQDEADITQTENPDEPFQLIINLEKWRTLVDKKYKAKKAACETNTDKDALDSCFQQ